MDGVYMQYKFDMTLGGAGLVVQRKPHLAM